MEYQDTKQHWHLIHTLRAECFEKFNAYDREAQKKKYTRKGKKGLGSRLRGMARAYFDMYIHLSEFYPEVKLSPEDQEALNKADATL